MSAGVRLLPSLTDLAFVMPIGMLFLVLNGARTMLGDGDTGWHVRTGEWILSNGRVPNVDIFSYTKAGQPWFAWEWGWDVLFGWLHLNWGMAPVVSASILTLCFTFALVYQLCTRISGNVIVAIAVTFAAMAASSIHWLARPHLFTLLFVVIFQTILTAAEKRPVSLVWLPAVTVLWTNLHGGFFVGIMLTACYGAGSWLRATFAASPEERQTHFRAGVPFVAASVGCLLVSLCNPYGYKLHLHILQYLTEPYHREHISEFMSTSFQPSLSRFFEILLALGILTTAWNVRRRKYVPALLISIWAHLGLLAGRNIPVYVIVAAPFVAEYLHHLWSVLVSSGRPAWLRRIVSEAMLVAKDAGSLDRIQRLHVASFAVFAGVTLLIGESGASGKWRAEFDSARYPKAALSALLPEATDRIFTDDEWGDYLAYTLYPNGKVFVDGRSDFYGAEFGRTFLSVLEVRHDWQHTLDAWSVSTVLLPIGSPLASTLKESRRWRVSYDDGVAVVFRPSAVSAGGQVAFPDPTRGRATTKTDTVVRRPPNITYGD